jgi:O-antigen/teichoic acid export membrane protein
LGLWLGLIGFFFFLRSGAQTLAYGYASILGMVGSSLFPWAMVQLGPHRFRFRLRSIRWRDLKELFDYSASIFIIGLAIQVVFLSQSLVITKLLGLAAVALFTASSKAGTLVMQLLWRTFDSLTPHWQKLYIAKDFAHLSPSFQRYTRLTMSLSIMAGTILILLNRPFVSLWAKPELYAGAVFDLLLMIYILQHTWNHCLAFGPVVAKDLRPLTILAVVDMILNIGLSMIFVLYAGMGVNGVLIGGILGTAVTTVYLTVRAPRYFSLSTHDLIGPCLFDWCLMFVFAATSFACVRWAHAKPFELSLLAILCGTAIILFLFLHRDDVREFAGRAKLFARTRAG